MINNHQLSMLCESLKPLAMQFESQAHNGRPLDLKPLRPLTVETLDDRRKRRKK